MRLLKVFNYQSHLFCTTAFSLLLLMPVQASFAIESKETTQLQQFTPTILNEKEMEWIGERIYQNECASNPKYLTYWGEGEEFPSLGIGHFIWYTNHYQASYYETFPSMVHYVSQYKKPPNWLIALSPLKAPWHSKREFDQAWSNSKMTALRSWLLDTKGLQAEFIAQQVMKRVNESLIELHANSPEKALNLQKQLKQLLSFKEGRFAVIDYVNFKGVGNQKEQYQGQQWGLFSVLEQMNINDVDYITNTNKFNQKRLLESFVESSKSRLALRVDLSPQNRGEKRWLEGWFKRLDGYIKKD